eukprot:CAMPEP_0194200064 /NCGR_PEP_ID=MMETSP0156-20130528/838_1 /TAXON_ID=33649 /ORGANISM="Thalassionema nitzschioides, Strain L26-B" /LENGTH=868 /DNA_ID=CAMNT_0038925031 /DNA_START=56 /DNA_END=2662 /DNA_ORIENTATION=+
MGSATAQKRRMGIWTILAIATVLAVIIGLFIFFALYDPDGGRSRPPSVPGDIVPTASPFPTTSFKPSLSPTITAQPTADIPLNRMCVGRDDQRYLNTDDMDKYLDENEEFHFVELLLFRGGDRWQEIGLTVYEERFYPMFEKALNEVGGKVEFVLGYGAQFGSLSTSWNGALVTYFPNGDAFRDFLDDPRLTDRNTNFENLSRSPFEWRKAALLDSRSWATRLNSEPRLLFRNLRANHTSDPTPNLAMLHAMMFKKSVPGLGTGKELVSRFDGDTENEKADEIIRAQGWFTVEATCTGEGAPFQEIRIESAPGMEAYNQIIQEDRWIDSQRYRQRGIEEATFSTLSYPVLLSDLYDSGDQICLSDAETCLAIFPRVTITRDPGNNCDFGTCPCDSDLRSCSGGEFFVPRVAGRSVGDETCPYQLCSPRTCRDDARVCPVPDNDLSYWKRETHFTTRDPHDSCSLPACRELSCNDDVRLCPKLGYVGRDISNNCEFHSCDLSCNEDEFTCDNGERVKRNPYNQCRYYSCPKSCQKTTKQCPDGSEVGEDSMNGCDHFPCHTCSPELKKCPELSGVDYVSRNPADECNFFPCVDRTNRCPTDKKQCAFGPDVGRDIHNNCEFFPCSCALDTQSCGTGFKSVARNPDNNCEFFPCEKTCTLDVKQCPNGSIVHRDPHNHCKFPSCRQECPDDKRRCPSGFYQERDPNNDCKFPPCIDVCPADFYRCPNGNRVSRNPKNYCRFDPCFEEICSKDTRVCGGDKPRVGRNFEVGCEFSDQDCDNVCEQDVKYCPDGKGLLRDPNNNCEHPSCPTNGNCDMGTTAPCGNGGEISASTNCNTRCEDVFTCLPDIRKCNNGSIRHRDPFNGCQLKNC